MTVRRLTLIRHAKASTQHSRDQRDFERPLGERGENDAERMGKRLAALGFQPDLVVSSTAERALRTAMIIADRVGHATGSIVTRDDLYLASRGKLQKIVQETAATVGHLVLVGHNPGMSDLWGWLADDHGPSMPTCGIVRIELSHGSWANTARGDAVLLDFDFPMRDPIEGI